VPEEASSPDSTDLASNRAGEGVEAKARALREAAPVRTFIARLLRVHTAERAWRLGGDGEQAVAEQLLKLGPAWRVLHSIVLSDTGTDLDHLVIGPGGVFCINSKNHPRAAVWAAGEIFMVNGQYQPYVRASKSEAKKVSRVLTAACGFEVAVTAVIAVVNANTLNVKEQPPQVRISSRRHLVEWLGAHAHCLTPAQVDSIYGVARRSTMWVPKEKPAAHVRAQTHVISERPVSSPTDNGDGAATGRARITISHNAALGARLVGDPRPHTRLVRAAGFRWSANQRLWYIPDSRDRPAHTISIGRLAGELRELGFEVEVDL